MERLVCYMPPRPGGGLPPPRTGLSWLGGCKGGFLPAELPSFGDFAAAEADRKLFRALVTNPGHVLDRLLLPKVKSIIYNPRPLVHGFVLPVKDNCNFVPLMLHDKIYCEWCFRKCNVSGSDLSLSQSACQSDVPLYSIIIIIMTDLCRQTLAAKKCFFLLFFTI